MPGGGIALRARPMSDVPRSATTFHHQTAPMLDMCPRCRRRVFLLKPVPEVLAHGHENLKDPLLSPVYGDMKGFSARPSSPAERAICLLSNTVRVHRPKPFRQAGIEAVWQVPTKDHPHAHSILADDKPRPKPI